MSSIIPGGGGDFTSYSGWEAAISADPASAETGSLDEAADGGAFTINVSNTNNVTLTATVGATFRHSDQTGWPNIGRVVGTAGRIVATGTIITVSTNNVTISYMMLRATGFGGKGILLNVHDNLRVTHTAIFGTGGNVRGIETTASGSWGGLTVDGWNNVIVGCKEAWQMSDVDSTWKNCTALGYASGTISGDYGWRSHRINLDNTTTLDNCIAVGFHVEDYGEAGSPTTAYAMTNCISEDATGTSGKTGVRRNQVVRRCAADDWNPELINDTNGQAAPDNAVWLFGAEGGDFFETSEGSAISVATGAAQEDTYGDTMTITNSLGAQSSQYLRHVDGVTGTSTTVYFEFRARSGWTMGTGERHRFFEIINAGNTAFLRFEIREDSGNIEIRLQRLSFPTTVAGTFTAVTVGTWYKVKIRMDIGDNPGIVDWFVAPVGSSFGTAIDSWSGLDLSGAAAVATFEWDISSVDAGTSGNLDFDTHIFADGDVDENDGTSGWGDSVEGNASFQGTHNAAITDDIRGQARANPPYIGAWEIPAAVGGATFPPHMALMGVGQ